MKFNAKIPILLAEDDQVDVMAVRRAMRQEQWENAVHVASDGHKALTLLKQWDDSSPRPGIALLDINLPKLSGLELLDALRGDAVLDDLLVVMLTTSLAPRDLQAAERHNVSGYICKPDSSEEMCHALRRVRQLWDDKHG